MTDCPECAKLKAAIVEWHVAKNRCYPHMPFIEGQDRIDQMYTTEARLDAIARAVLAERAEGKGHAGA